MCVPTGEDQKWTQSQTKQDDWPEETQKNCPRISDLNSSLSEPDRVCLSTHTFFLLMNILLVSLLSISLLKLLFLQSRRARALLLAAGPGLVISIRCPHCFGLASTSGQGTEILLQAATGPGHQKSQPPPSSCPRLPDFSFSSPSIPTVT